MKPGHFQTLDELHLPILDVHFVDFEADAQAQVSPGQMRNGNDVAALRTSTCDLLGLISRPDVQKERKEKEEMQERRDERLAEYRGKVGPAIHAHDSGSCAVGLLEDDSRCRRSGGGGRRSMGSDSPDGAR